MKPNNIGNKDIHFEYAANSRPIYKVNINGKCVPFTYILKDKGLTINIEHQMICCIGDKLSAMGVDGFGSSMDSSWPILFA